MARPVPERVAPGYSPIGAGLPEYMPMPQEPEYPRSPHARVLPQTPETQRQPGVWASDEPLPYVGRASPEVVLGVRIPMPDGDEPAVRDERYLMAMCAVTLNFGIGSSPQRPELESLDRKDKTCLVAKLYDTCLERFIRSLAENNPTWSKAMSNPEEAKNRFSERLAKFAEQTGCMGYHYTGVSGGLITAFRSVKSFGGI